MWREDYERFAELTFDDFRRMANDESLSPMEKVGFPDEYREGAEGAIFEDIVSKLPALSHRGSKVLDIGPGCSGLARMMVEHCVRHGHTLVLVDSAEMLAKLPDRQGVVKIAARYPDSPSLFDLHAGSFDAILTYSVLQVVFLERSVWEFLDRSLELLAHGGTMLIGDIPNQSKRKRFFSSPAGVEFHRRFTGSEEPPMVAFNVVEPGQMDDAVVLGLLSRARTAGCDAYVVGQRIDLPMANRREDIVIHRP